MTVKNIANCNNVNSVNSLYLMIGHFEEKSGHKYLILDVNENKKVSKKYEKNVGWN